MTCPKCGFVQPDRADCARCGVVVARYVPRASDRPPGVEPPPREAPQADPAEPLSRRGRSFWLAAAGVAAFALAVFIAARPRASPARVAEGSSAESVAEPVPTLAEPAWSDAVADAPTPDGAAASNTLEAAAATASCPVDQASSPAGSRPSVSRQWHEGADDYGRAEQEQTGSGAAMLVYFYTDWCQFCRALEERLLSAGEVERYLGDRMVKVRVNPEAGSAARELARQYGVSGVPALFLVTPAAAPERVSPYGARVGDEDRALMAPEEFVGKLQQKVAGRAQRAVSEASRRRSGGDAAGALALLDQALGLDPDNPGAHRESGLARTLTGDLDRALADLRRARDLEPAALPVYEAIEFALGQKARWAEAAACWTGLIEREPGAAKAYLRRGGSFFRAGARAAALADAETACNLGEPQGCDIVRRLKG